MSANYYRLFETSWNVIKFTRDCLWENNADIVMATVWFPLDNTKLKFADLSGNQLPINFNWSKNNFGEIQISQALDWAFPSVPFFSLVCLHFRSDHILHVHVPPWNFTSLFSKLISNWKSNPWLFYQCRVIPSSSWGHVITLTRLWVVFSLSTLNFKTVDWSLTTRIK